MKAESVKKSDPVRAAYKAAKMSDDLYSNETMSKFDLAKGFSQPVAARQFDKFIPRDVKAAGNQLQARRKLIRIMHSKSVKETSLAVGDRLDIFQKK